MVLKSNIDRINSLKMLLSVGTLSFWPTALLSQVVRKGCDVCEKAWEGLDKFTRTRYQFRYINRVDCSSEAVIPPQFKAHESKKNN